MRSKNFPLYMAILFAWLLGMIFSSDVLVRKWRAAKQRRIDAAESARKDKQWRESRGRLWSKLAGATL
jgi:hypothetical protein